MTLTMEIRPAAPAASVRTPNGPGLPCREDFVREVYQRHGSLLLRYAARLVGGDWHLAEDLLQEAATRGWVYFTSVDPDAEAEKVRPWLFTVVRNLAIDQHRARQNRPLEQMSIEDVDVPGVDEMERALTSHVVVEAFKDLSDQHREVVMCMYYLGYSVAQASEHLGIPPGTVKSRCHYAIRSLRKALHQRGLREG
ncbi:sigma-70 family RNA polymerase sigma factor [Streptomyces sp. DH37]|uniref:sigma-70 family RNA polymerase sigma factor n=1 Tax=Streptomyces sp. DH37 TaxID=3040122 RepID=UPI0024427E24|nr:sigma-70 family RNA polymerase sigma factor [Streptomyces sp. DH37]MDG9706146.1 sigma-70 family RNA polymerase sigma factor [Streptomyces sp. DH37]